MIARFIGGPMDGQEKKIPYRLKTISYPVSVSPGKGQDGCSAPYWIERRYHYCPHPNETSKIAYYRHEDLLPEKS